MAGHVSTMAISCQKLITTTGSPLDVAGTHIAGDHASENGALFYHIEPRCGSLPCSPYVPKNELTCTVCSK